VVELAKETQLCPIAGRHHNPDIKVVMRRSRYRSFVDYSAYELPTEPEGELTTFNRHMLSLCLRQYGAVVNLHITTADAPAVVKKVVQKDGSIFAQRLRTKLDTGDFNAFGLSRLEGLARVQQHQSQTAAQNPATTSRFHGTAPFT
jgi:hypothetical protein